MSYSFVTSSLTAKNGLLNQSVAGQMDLDLATRGNSSTFVGYDTPTSISGQSNTMIGYQAGLYATGRDNLLFIGVNAGMSNRTSGNIFIGNRAGQYNQFGYNLTCVGNDSSFCNEDGYSPVYNNSFFGQCTGNYAIGYENIFIGTSNNSTPYTLRSYKNVSVGNYSVINGCNCVQVGYSNYCAGMNTVDVGTRISDYNSNNIIIGHDIINYGCNCVILKTNTQGIYQNYQNNYINVQDVIVGSNATNGKYVLRFQTDQIVLQTSDGNQTTLGGQSNSVNATYYSITANLFNINANTVFSLPTTFNGQLIANADMTVNGITTFNNPVIFNSPQLTFTSVLNLLSNVNIKGELDVYDQSYFKDQANFLSTINVAGTSTFGNDMTVNGDINCDDLVVHDNLWVANGRATFCNDMKVLGTSTLQGILNVMGESIFDSNVEIDDNLVVWGQVNLGGDLDVAGGVVIDSNLILVGDADINGSGRFSGPVTMSSNLVVNGNITAAAGTGTFNNLNILSPVFTMSNNFTLAGTAQFLNTTTFQGLSTFCNTTAFQAATNFNSVVTTNSNFYNTQTSFLSNLSVSGQSTLDDVTINGALTLNTPLVLSNDVYNYGRTFDYGQTYYYNKVTAYDGMDVASNLNSTGTFTANGTSTFNDTAYFNSNATFCNCVLSQGPFLQMGIATFSNALTTYGQVVLSNAVDVYGTATFHGAVNIPTVSASNILLDKLVVYDSTTLNGNTVVNGSIYTNGSSTFCNQANFMQTTTMYGFTEFDNLAIFNCNVEMYLLHGVAGAFDDMSVRSNLQIVGSVSTIGSSVFSGTTTFCNTTTLQSQLEVNGRTDFNNFVSFNSNIEASSVNIDNLYINSNLNVSGSIRITGNTQYDGTTTFCNNVNIQDQLQVNGETTFEDRTHFSSNVDMATFYACLGSMDNVSVNSNLRVVGSLLASGNTFMTGSTTFCNQIVSTGTFTQNSLATFNSNVSLSSSLQVYGTGRFESNVVVSGNLQTNQDLLIYGTSTFSNDVCMKGNLLTMGNTELLGTLTMSNNAQFLGPVDFENNVTIRGGFVVDTLEANKSVQLNSTVTINSNLNVQSTAEFRDDVTMDSNLNILGDLLVGNNLIVKGEVTYCNIVVYQGSELELENATFVGSVMFSNNTDFNGVANFNSNVKVNALEVVQNVCFDSNLTINNNLDVWGLTSMRANATINSNLVVFGSAELDRTLIVYGVSTFSNDLYVSGDIVGLGNSTFRGLVGFSNFTSFANLTYFNSNVYIDAPLQVSQNAVINSNLDVYGITNIHDDVIFNSNLQVQGNARLNQDFVVSGTSTLGTVAVQGPFGAFANSFFYGQTTFCNQIVSYGSLTQNVQANFNGNTVFNSNVTMSQLEVIGNTLLNSSLNVSGHCVFDGVSTFNDSIIANNTLDFYGTTNFHNDATVSSNLHVIGSTLLNNLFVDGSTTFSNNVTTQGRSVFLGQATFSSAIFSDITVSAATITGPLNIDSSNLIVSGCNLSNYLQNLTNLSSFSASNTTFQGSTTINSNLYVSEIFAQSGNFSNLNISSDSVFNGSAYMSDATISNVYVNGSLNISGSNLIVSGCNFANYIESITSLSSFSASNTTFQGSATVDSNLCVLGNGTFAVLNVTSNAQVTTLFCDTATMDTISVNSNIYIGGCNLANYLDRINELEIGLCNIDVVTINTSNVLTNIISSSNGTFDVLNVRNNAMFGQSNVFIGGCNLANYLEKIQELLTGSNATYVNASNMIVTELQSSDAYIEILNVTSNATFNQINSAYASIDDGMFNSLTVSCNVNFGISNVYVSGCNLANYLNDLRNLSNTFSTSSLDANSSTFNFVTTNGIAVNNIATFGQSNVYIGGCNLGFYLTKIANFSSVTACNVPDLSNLNALSITTGNLNADQTSFNIVSANTLSVNNIAEFGRSNVYIGGCNLGFYLDAIANFSGGGSNTNTNTNTTSNAFIVNGVFDTLSVNSNCVLNEVEAIDISADKLDASTLNAIHATFINTETNTLDVNNNANFGKSNVYIGGCNLGWYLDKIQELSSGSNVINDPDIHAIAITTDILVATTINGDDATFESVVTSVLEVESTANIISLTATNLSSGMAFIEDGTFDTINVNSNLYVGGCNLENYLNKILELESSSNSTAAGDFTIGCNLFVDGSIVCKNSGTFSNELSVGGDTYLYSDLFVNGTTTLTDLTTIGISSFCNSVYFNENVFLSELDTYIDGCNLYYYLSKLRGSGSHNTFENSNLCSMSNYIIETANVTLTDSVYVESNLVVGGGLIVQGQCCMQNVEFTDIVVTNMNVSGLNIAGPVVMQDSALIQGHLCVLGATTLCNDIILQSSSYFNGPMTAYNSFFAECNIVDNGTLFVSGNTTLSNATEIYGNLDVFSEASFSSNVYVASTLVSSNVITKGISVLNAMTIASNLYVKGTTTLCNVDILSGSIDISGRASFASNVSMNNLLTTQSLQVTGAASFGGSVVMNETVNMNSNLSVAANLVVFGNTTLCNNLVVGGTILSSSNTLTTGGLSVLGNTTLSNVEAQGIVVNGVAVFNNHVDIQDIFVAHSNVILLEDLSVYGMTTLCNIEISGNASVASNLSTQGLQVSGAASFGGSVVMNETVNMNSNLDVSQNLVVFGNTTLCNNLVVNGNILSGSNTLTTGGLSVLGDAFLAGTMTLSNLATDGLVVTGIASFYNPVDLQDIVVAHSNVIILEDLSVYGNGTFINSVSSCNIQTSSFDVSGTAYLQNATVGMLDVNDTSIFQQPAVFSNTCVIDDKLKFTCSNDDWFIFTQSNGPMGADLVFESTHKTRVTFTDDFEPGQFNFTGCHRCKFKTTDIDKETQRQSLLGKIVVATGNYNNLENTEIITMSEAIPVVELSKTDQDKRVFGVIAGFEEHTSKNRYFKIGNIRFNKNKSIEDTKIIVNSIGEGAIKVCNFNGNLENGDLITSSDVEGYGVKQNDDLIHNYTIAKITTDVNWDNFAELKTKFVCGTEKKGKRTIKWALVGCVYLC